MSRKLVVNDGRREREVLLVGTMVVGRDPTCDISDADSLLSRRHVEFVAGAKDVTVRDLGSRNGILINGVKIAQSVLRAGDVVQVGHLQVRFVEDDSPLVMPSDETAIRPNAGQRTGAPSRGQQAATPMPPGADAPTIAAHSSIHVDEPTQRVVRPGFSQNQAVVDTELDRTIPAILPADPPPAGRPAAADFDKTRFAGVAVSQAGSVAPRVRGAEKIPIDPDQDKTRFVPPAAPTVLVPEPARVVRRAWKSIVFAQVVGLSAFVFLATAIPLILFPANGTNRAAVLIMPAIVMLAAAWFTSRQIHRQTMKALPELNDEARHPSGREI